MIIKQKLLSISFFALLVFISFRIQESKQTLENSFLLCCNSTLCDAELCSSPSTIQLKSNGCPSQDQNINCEQCINYLIEGNVCGWSDIPYVFCWKNGYRYSSFVGLEDVLTAGLDGPTSLEPNTNGTFYTFAQGGSQNYSYTWYIYYPCDDEKMEQIEEQIDAIPCGEWSQLGATSSSLVRSDYKDFWLKCVVRDNNNNDQVVTNVLVVEISS